MKRLLVLVVGLGLIAGGIWATTLYASAKADASAYSRSRPCPEVSFTPDSRDCIFSLQTRIAKLDSNPNYSETGGPGTCNVSFARQDIEQGVYGGSDCSVFKIGEPASVTTWNAKVIQFDAGGQSYYNVDPASGPGSLMLLILVLIGLGVTLLIIAAVAQIQAGTPSLGGRRPTQAVAAFPSTGANAGETSSAYAFIALFLVGLPWIGLQLLLSRVKILPDTSPEHIAVNVGGVVALIVGILALDWTLNDAAHRPSRPLPGILRVAVVALVIISGAAIPLVLGLVIKSLVG